MNRKQFLTSIIPLPFVSSAMRLNELNHFINSFNKSERMPLLFLGHGSPMNAIEENEFVQGFRNAGKNIPKPNAILCISAHWETQGTLVTAMESPRTIHDFSGFPKALYDVQYPVLGSPYLAKETKELVSITSIDLDEKWGLDHGAWSVIKHLYPQANVPVIQLSLDYTKPPQYHYDLAKELNSLRNKGVLIIGSGNMVHNLGMIAWDKLNANDYGYEWAFEASQKMKEFILDDDHQSLINYTKQGKAFQLSIPTPEHYLPLLYVLALKEKKERLKFFNDKAVGGSLTMTSLKIETI